MSAQEGGGVVCFELWLEGLGLFTADLAPHSSPLPFFISPCSWPPTTTSPQFNDSLLYAQEQAALSTYVSPRIISLDGVKITENIGAVPGLAHAIRIVSQSKSFILGTTSLAEKLQWMQRFNEVLEERMRSGDTAPEGKLSTGFGAIAPVWVSPVCLMHAHPCAEKKSSIENCFMFSYLVVLGFCFSPLWLICTDP